MSRVFLINIGSNSSHSAVARSPLFQDGSFLFVPFPNAGGAWVRNYPRSCRPFVRTSSLKTHDDPDWTNLTYGDDCANGRAGSLQQVAEGDILLFWGMLWGNRGSSWQHFDGSFGWYLFGALRVAEIIFWLICGFEPKQPNKSFYCDPRNCCKKLSVSADGDRKKLRRVSRMGCHEFTKAAGASSSSLSFCQCFRSAKDTENLIRRNRLADFF